ncbi:MAG: hypothetical protein RLZZ574_918 [Cyanobacteriota bacterium]|jgi:ribosomal protein L37E
MTDYVLRLPTSEEVNDLKEMAKIRRQVLAKNGISTYLVGFRKGHISIMCLCCGMISYNRNDRINKYCGFCKVSFCV